MQSEQFDKKTKEAADHHHPAYDEQAWNRMEKLLDKHLPQKEEGKKRFIFFLLLLLLAGGGTWLLLSKPWQGDKKIAAGNPVEKSSSAESSVKDDTTGKNTPAVSPENNIASNNENSNGEPVAQKDQLNMTGQPVNNNVSAKNNVTRKNVVPGSKLLTNKNDQTSFAISNGTKASKRNKDSKEINNKEVNDQPVTNANPSIQNDGSLIPATPSEKKKPVTNTSKPVASSSPATATEKPAQKEDPVMAKAEVPETLRQTQGTTTKKKNDKNKKKNSLFFSLSAGPDLSFVGSGNSSKTKLVAGAGIGFTFKDKITLRTGFYSGRKVYSARPSDYKAPPAFYTFYPYLEKVDANCKVYEIPVSLSYNFGKKNNWFVSAGVSSFLMKEESYDYIYKYTPTGNTYTNNWTIKNENSHYFSIGTLSAGYKHNIGKKITVMAEPYIKVPFGGVGYGKVKLNSGGVLFTIGVKAF